MADTLQKIPSNLFEKKLSKPQKEIIKRLTVKIDSFIENDEKINIKNSLEEEKVVQEKRKDDQI